MHWPVELIRKSVFNNQTCCQIVFMTPIVSLMVTSMPSHIRLGMRTRTRKSCLRLHSRFVSPPIDQPPHQQTLNRMPPSSYPRIHSPLLRHSAVLRQISTEAQGSVRCANTITEQSILQTPPALLQKLAERFSRCALESAAPSSVR